VTSAQCDVNPGYTPLDHDQRNTLNTGYSSALPLRTFASMNVQYGSGFTNGNPNIISTLQSALKKSCSFLLNAL